ncbi:MAG: outer membrane protein transport protein [Gammaproteobacteria bacterium]|nr:outer membrane protein transport protein [Gammaproteobacteria bacterium]
MKIVKQNAIAMALGVGLALPNAAIATNGMNLEGYGPIALGMGGASMAYDNGTAAVMNNPATLGLMGDGESRVDGAVGFLGPDVTSSAGGQSWSSSADAFYMPAVGFATKQSGLTYGFAMFAQGGMGTEYAPGPGAWMSAGHTQLSGGDAATIAKAGSLKERSEIGVARLVVPVAYDIDDKLTIGGSIDYVRANMDLQMAMAGNMMSTMMGQGLITGSMVDTMGMMQTNGWLSRNYFGYFDFSDNDDFSGQTSADGFAGKLGLTFKISEALTMGATYHSKTDLGDMTGPAKVTMGVRADTGVMSGGAPSSTHADFIVPLTGTVKIVDFQWPETYGIGAAFKASPKLMVAADLKIIKWSDVMKDFKMSFTASGDASNGGFANKTMNATMPQNWDDQTVIQVGAAYAVSQDMTVRAGINKADNPIPANTVNYLFPAIIEEHYTAGIGYNLSKQQGINFAMSYAPEVSATNSQTNVTTTHSQMSWQLMYSQGF